ncbi:hypothetical protein PC119_g26037 [Phytophthora cactorum]|nr:hypothetical protein PC119_g26037 [Phytophthora cactorum]
MQEVDKRGRAIGYASKMLVGSQRNWVNKTRGTTEIECWGNRMGYAQALTWIFGENMRTSNAKLTRWTMELSQLRFKVHHRPGTSMGHADGLLRLYHRPGVSVVGVIRMSDLLNADKNGAASRDGTQTQNGAINRNAADVPVAVGEPNLLPPGVRERGRRTLWLDGRPVDCVDCGRLPGLYDRVLLLERRRIVVELLQPATRSPVRVQRVNPAKLLDVDGKDSRGANDTVKKENVPVSSAYVERGRITSAGAKIASPASVGTHPERVPAATAEGTVRPAADDAARRGRRASVRENCHGPQLDGGLAILADCIQKVCSLQTLCTTSNQLSHPAKSSAFQV